MSRALFIAGIVFAVIHPALAQVRGEPVTTTSSRINLNPNWAVQTSAAVPHTGAEISSPGFDTTSWYRTSVPSTVIAALVDNGLYPDPYYGLNLRQIPGTTYDWGDNFAVDPMPTDSPFTVSWWYRSEFKLPRTKGRRLWLNFDSINYRANIWLNGTQIASSDQARGMYRMFEFDVTDIALAGRNVLAVEVFAPTENDFSISFVDWNPLPADKDMGLVRDVYIRTSGPVSLRHTQVVTQLNSTFDQARLTVYTDLNNPGSDPVDGTLHGTIGGIAIDKPVHLAAGQSTRISLTPQEFPQLIIAHPELWWPYGLGPQILQKLHLEFRAGGAVSDMEDVQFGIRQFTSELDAKQHRLFRINGKRILIRGAAWTPEMMLRVNDERDEQQLRYVREMNLNTIRLEGKLEMNEHFFDTADRLGIMIMPGWCCCSFFEQWDKWKPDDYTIAAESLRSQLRRLRNHASVFVFLYGSDAYPPPAAEQVYLRVLAEENWPLPTLASASDNTTTLTGRTGVKMTGPYDYVAPNYWLEDTLRGGAWGFITETSPGPAVPELASLEQMMPKEYLWPPLDNNMWTFHAGSGSFADVINFTHALEGRYGAARDIADYTRKSQIMTYEAERAMFEAYGRNKYTATGVIQWMLNNAWPGLIWHLYDFYLRPGGGYFGTRKANERLHVQYSYDDNSIVVVNSLYNSFPGYSVTAKVYNIDLAEKYSRTVALDIAEDSSTRVFYLPAIPDLSRTYFVRLDLTAPDGTLASHNFYWLSTQPDVIDFAGGDYRCPPITTYADLTALAQLSPASVSVASQPEDNGFDRIEHITVRNTSLQLALFVHLEVLQGKGGSDIAPVYWDDNYFELMPGEERQLTATYPAKLLNGGPSYIQVDGLNVATTGN